MYNNFANVPMGMASSSQGFQQQQQPGVLGNQANWPPGLGQQSIAGGSVGMAPMPMGGPTWGFGGGVLQQQQPQFPIGHQGFSGFGTQPQMQPTTTQMAMTVSGGLAPFPATVVKQSISSAQASGQPPTAAPFEIPEQMQAQHDCQFYQDSENYEDSLRQLQLVVLIDHSGSMRSQDEDGAGLDRTRGTFGEYWSRWDNCIQTAKYLADSLLQYDVDGTIPLIFFGHYASEEVVRDRESFLDAMKRHAPNQETTNLLEALTLAFDRHVNDQESTLFVVLTDGAPNDGQQPYIKRLIHERLTVKDPRGTRLNLLFIRFGDDSGAISFLRELDDCVEIRQTVDTKSDNAVYAMGPKNLIANAIHEHLDAKYAHVI